jgi:mycothiol synthase
MEMPLLRQQIPTKVQVRPARLEDAEIVAAVLNASERDYIGVEGWTADELRLDWQTPGFDLEQDTCLMLDVDGQPLAYGDVWAVQDPPVSPFALARVHPQARSRGLGSALLAWQEARSLELLPRIPTEARLSMQTFIYHGQKPAQDLLEAFGMRLVRHFWRMRIEFDRPPQTPNWPEELTLRPYRHDQDARVFFEAERDAFRDHWGFVETPFEQAYELWRHLIFKDKKFDPELFFLIWDGEQIAGTLRLKQESDDDPQLGWVQTLGVRRPWRRRGLGLALLQHAFVTLYARGQRAAGLGVDAANPTGATRLYAKAGMTIKRQHDVFEKELRPGIELRQMEQA